MKKTAPEKERVGEQHKQEQTLRRNHGTKVRRDYKYVRQQCDHQYLRCIQNTLRLPRKKRTQERSTRRTGVNASLSTDHADVNL